MYRSTLAWVSGVYVLLVFCTSVQAEVTSIQIDSRESPTFEGRSFGEAGTYENVIGRAFGELDPFDSRNAIIHDLELAPRNERGRVAYVATFTMIKPVDMSRSSGVLVYSVPNRGNHLMAQALQGGDPGDGFLYNRGHTILYSGWQGDLQARPGIETITVPVAKNEDGSAITGKVLHRFFDHARNAKSLVIPSVYPPFSLDTRQALLTRRTSDDSAVVPISPDDWAFANCDSEPFPGVPDPTRISIRGGIDETKLYEIVYTAKDPLVLGIGLAATRDIVSHFRYGRADAENLLENRVTHVIAQGISQAGNFIKTFLHLGFNEDESSRIVWDGANPHIAARQLPINFRFARPGGAASMYEPGSEGVLWWGTYTDSVRGLKTGSLLDRSIEANVCPKVFETYGSAEYWGLRMSPGIVGTEADEDIPLPDAVRRYYFPGTTHGGGRGGFDLELSRNRTFQLPGNQNPQTETMRALFDALIAWTVHGEEPPESRYPLLSSGDLVGPNAESMGFPLIPGWPLPNNLLNQFLDYDFGPRFDENTMKGELQVPPTIRRIIPSLAPRVDRDGNEIGGVPSVQHMVPLGTYLGWNVKEGGYYHNRASGFFGGFIPFAETRKEREERQDPRLSLAERYENHAGFVDRVRIAATKLVNEGFLLEDDAERIVQEADASSILSN